MSDREWERRTAVIEYKHRIEEKIKEGIGVLLVTGYLLHLLEVATR